MRQEDWDEKGKDLKISCTCNGALNLVWNQVHNWTHKLLKSAMWNSQLFWVSSHQFTRVSKPICINYWLTHLPTSEYRSSECVALHLHTPGSPQGVMVSNTETSVYFTYFLFEPLLLQNTISWHKNILIYATHAKVLIPHLMPVILMLDHQPHDHTSP